MTGQVMEMEVTGGDINNFLEKLQPLLDKTNGVVVQAGIITLLLQTLGPDDITDAEMIQGVHDISTNIIAYTQQIRSTAPAAGAAQRRES